jgi:hypothetical protein
MNSSAVKGFGKEEVGITPLNISMLKKIAKSERADSLMLEGELVYNIEIVCKITAKREENIRIAYTLTDESGNFDGVIYKSDSVVQPVLTYIFEEGGYAQIIGIVKKFQDVD